MRNKKGQILKFTKIRPFHVKIRKKIHNNIMHFLKEFLKDFRKEIGDQNQIKNKLSKYKKTETTICCTLLPLG